MISNIGNNVYYLRKARKMTQRDLAAAVYVSKAMICKYENGTATMPVDTFIRIAEYFGVSLDELAGRYYG